MNGFEAVGVVGPWRERGVKVIGAHARMSGGRPGGSGAR